MWKGVPGQVVDWEAQLAKMEARLKEASDELDHLRQTCENQMGFIHSSKESHLILTGLPEVVKLIRGLLQPSLHFS